MQATPRDFNLASLLEYIVELGRQEPDPDLIDRVCSQFLERIESLHLLPDRCPHCGERLQDIRQLQQSDVDASSLQQSPFREP